VTGPEAVVSGLRRYVRLVAAVVGADLFTVRCASAPRLEAWMPLEGGFALRWDETGGWTVVAADGGSAVLAR
jgi:hypothetical protein